MFKKKTNNNVIRFASVIIALAIMIPLFSIGGFSEEMNGYGIIDVPSTLNVRSGPGTSFSKIVSLPNGWPVEIKGSELDSYQELWYHITFMREGRTMSGYVSASYVQPIEVKEDEAFEAHLTAEGFPESYKKSLRILHAIYPSWVFDGIKTGIDWNDAVKKESAFGINLIEKTSDDFWINLADVDKDGQQVIHDAGKWVTASEAAIKYYMDPRNFLTGSYIFQFLEQSYSSGENYSVNGVEAILADTYMASPATFTAHESEFSYAEMFMLAADLSGVSPYHLASRSKMEIGVNGSTLSHGTVPGYEGFYNFYNIGAYSTSEYTAMEKGAIYAQKTSPEDYMLPWDNIYDAIAGGACFLGSGYILNNQDTAYFQKFNVANGLSKVATHQYMGCVYGPASEASITRSAYSMILLQTALVFKLPIYENMPETNCAKPTDADPNGYGDASPSDISESSAESSTPTRRGGGIVIVPQAGKNSKRTSDSSSEKSMTESSKSESSKSQASRQESSQEPSKSEASKYEPSQEPSKSEASKYEPSQEPSKSETSKFESSASESSETKGVIIVKQQQKGKSGFGYISRKSSTETSQPETSQPETSQPEASQPETSQPEASQPEASQPEASQPEASQPEASQPEQKKPQSSTTKTISGIVWTQSSSSSSGKNYLNSLKLK